MLTLQIGQARLAGYCSAKGRLMASFMVWKLQADEFLLACSADLVPTLVKRLSMFVLRARCRLADVSADTALWGWAGAQIPGDWHGHWPESAWTASPLTDGVEAVRLPDVAGLQRALLRTSADAGAPLEAPLPPDLWAALEVASGIVRIVPQTVEQFVPQMVNLELVGGVSFKKGCYPGQEVVARSQYRGTLKRRVALLRCEQALAPGQEVFQSQEPEQPAGTVALAANWPGGGPLALVSVKRTALEEGSLHLGAADGPALAAMPLPYEVPQDVH